VDGLWATKSEGVGLIVRAISFQHFQQQTDRQTDGRTDNMQSQYRALHYSAPSGKNSLLIFKVRENSQKIVFLHTEHDLL